ncbi:MAG: hypothetical protein KDA47_05000, partial [Planctomycetales bacterium]|nr:hypothetical protein [Planctomycetales bacterium]
FRPAGHCQVEQYQVEQYQVVKNRYWMAGIQTGDHRRSRRLDSGYSGASSVDFPYSEASCRAESSLPNRRPPETSWGETTAVRVA